MTKNKRGRQPLRADQRHSETIAFKISKVERRMIANAAADAGKKLPEWIRATLLGAAITSILEERTDQAEKDHVDISNLNPLKMTSKEASASPAMTLRRGE